MPPSESSSQGVSLGSGTAVPEATCIRVILLLLLLLLSRFSRVRLSATP